MGSIKTTISETISKWIRAPIHLQQVTLDQLRQLLFLIILQQLHQQRQLLRDVKLELEQNVPRVKQPKN